MGKRVQDIKEEALWIDWSAEVAHVLREDLIEIVQEVLLPKMNRKPFFFRTTNTSSQFGFKAVPESFWIGWQREGHNDFVRLDRPASGNRGALAQFQVISTNTFP